MSIKFDMTDKVLEQMSGKGAFLTVGDKPNTMTIGWGSVSVYWGMPVFIAPVRHSRYSYGLLESGTEFTVSVPLDGTMDKALGICGSRSGRDTDKYQLAGITTAEAKSVSVPVIEGCGYYYECKLICACDLDPELLPEDIKARFYAAGDGHKLFFGKIVAAYER